MDALSMQKVFELPLIRLTALQCGLHNGRFSSPGKGRTLVVSGPEEEDK